MTTVINTPSAGGNDSMGVGFILGMMVLVIAAGFLFFVYGLPMLQGSEPTTQNIEIKIPAPINTPTPTPIAE